MLKPRGAICDLDCSYCYYLKKEALYPKSDFRMSEEVLESFTRQYIESQLSPEIVFGWQGGEPTLMGIDFYRRAVELQRRYAKPGVHVLNTLQTNGVGLNAEWCEFFRDHEFLIGISIDGPAELHDVYRVDKGGKPTHARVMSGLALLREYGVDHNVLTTVHAANATRPLEVYRFLRDEVGTDFMQFIPIVERSIVGRGNVERGSVERARVGSDEAGLLSDRSVTGKAYGEFLIAIFDEWIRKDVGSVFVQLFDVALSSWTGQKAGLCIFEETCGRALALEHTGDLYSCDHFVNPDNLLGNVSRTELPVLVESGQQYTFGTDKKSTLPTQCLECEVRFVCNGGCPKNRFATSPEGDPGLNILCGGYRPFFNHIDLAMRYMVDALQHKAPPAGIMESLANGTDDELNLAYGMPLRAPELKTMT